MRIRLATRKSPLALAQTLEVKKQLLELYPKMSIDIIEFVTRGDEILDSPLYEVGGKSLFTKEIELALLENKADVAIHSLKDMSNEIHEDLQVVAVCERSAPHDVFLSNDFIHFNDIPSKSSIGTSSLRRMNQLKLIRKDLTYKVLRGNVNTRIEKLENHEYDAIILAAAGINRLKLNSKVCHGFSTSDVIPAVGQGALALQCRKKPDHISYIIKSLNCIKTSICTNAERQFSNRLGGSCKVSIGAYSHIDEDKIYIDGFVSNFSGSEHLKKSYCLPFNKHENIGNMLADLFINNGAKNLIINN